MGMEIHSNFKLGGGARESILSNGLCLCLLIQSVTLIKDYHHISQCGDDHVIKSAHHDKGYAELYTNILLQLSF